MDCCVKRKLKFLSAYINSRSQVTSLTTVSMLQCQLLLAILMSCVTEILSELHAIAVSALHSCGQIIQANRSNVVLSNSCLGNKIFNRINVDCQTPTSPWAWGSLPRVSNLLILNRYAIIKQVSLICI